MKSRILASFILVSLSLGTAFSQELNKAKLDSLFDVLAAKNKAMGSLAISRNGKLIYARAIGSSLISPTEKIPATVTTKYRIGSISKTFTATMIFQLIEAKKLSLTTTLNKYFPNIPNADKISIGNMLNHRSGLHNFTDDPEYVTWMTQPKTKDELVAIISKYPVDFQPNEKFAYSNSNYVLLGYIIEKITRQPYSKVLSSRITSKIGLKNTYIGGKTNVKINESFSYRFIKDWVQSPETDMSIPAGAGAIVSTPADLTRFIEALFDKKLVSENSLAQMKTVTDGYGMGMFQIPFYDKKAYGHNGGIDGFASTLGYFPEDKLAIAYCTNGQVYPVNDILIGALSIAFDKKYKVPTFEVVAGLVLKTEDLDKYLGVYSSKDMPLKITITKDNTILMAQATGQSAFPLDATEVNVFKFDAAGVRLEFDPDKSEMRLKQAGGNFLFTKEK